MSEWFENETLWESLYPFLDVASKEVVAKWFHPTDSQALPDDSLLMQRHEVVDDWSRIRNEWTMVRGGTAEVFRFQHTLYSAQELKDRLQQSGFQRIQVWGDLDGNEYGTNAQRLVAAAWK